MQATELDQCPNRRTIAENAVHHRVMSAHEEQGSIAVLPSDENPLQELYFVTSPEDIRQVLLSDNFVKTWNGDTLSTPDVDYVMNLVQPLLTGTAFNHGYDEAVKRRMALRPVTKSADHLLDAFSREIERVLDTWPVGQPFDALKLSHELLRANIMTILVGEESDFTYHHTRVWEEVLDYFVARYGAADFSPAVTDEDRVQMRRLKQVGQAIVADYKRLGLAELAGRDGRPLSVCALLLQAGVSDEEVAHTIVNLMVAGGEAPASIIAHCLQELAHNVNVCETLAAEIQQVVGNGRVADHLDELPYLEGVTREAFRVFAPATLVQRQALTDTTLGGRVIPKGTVVGVCVPAVHMDPNQFAEPEKFNPLRPGNRFEMLDKDQCVVTFGAGTRGCPGRHLAFAITRLALGEIVKRWTPVQNPADHTGLEGKVLKWVEWQVDGIPLTLVPRQ